MSTFITYRNGDNDLLGRLKAAVASFYQTQGGLPAGIVTHKSELEAATAAAVSLDLALPVTGSGGALVGEVWLTVKEK